MTMDKELANNWIKEYCVEPEIWKGASNIHILCYLLRALVTEINEMESQVEYNESREFACQRKLAASQARVRELQGQSTKWLIERGTPAVYFAGSDYGAGKWTSDAFAALHFESKKDAQEFWN